MSSATPANLSECSPTVNSLTRQDSPPSSANVKETNQITFEPSEIPSDPKNFQLSSKKYQKIKNEIDLQNFEVAKLTRELKMRTEHCFSADCLQQTKTELNNARKKLNLMIKCAMNEQKKSGENWGPIPLAFDRSSSSSLFCLEPNTPSNISEISGLNNHKLELDDFETLEEDRFSLQREILFKDKMLQELEQNLEATQCQILRISQENKAMTRRLNETQTETCRKHLNTKLNMQVEKATKLSYTIEKLSTNLKNLRCELDKLKEEKKISVNIQNCKNSSPRKCPGLSEDARKLKIFESKYSNLQNEFCQREKQHKEMTERMKIFLNNCNDDKEQAVNEALKKRARELDDEISENKIFIEELQEQVAIYRDKFMKSQEKVECQKYLLESLEMTNKDIELQISEEISRIKEKFQKKLSEFCPYPKKYEESKLELEDARKRSAILEDDLKLVIAALGKSKEELEAFKQEPDVSLKTKYKKLQCEVEMLKNKYCGIKSTKECLEEKLTCMKNELESLRKDSSKIISTTKCCAEKNRTILHQHINCLEIELAQCRASSTISLSQKEETIKKMKEELVMLCSSLTDCHAQIAQLKNQVTYLTNQRYKIRSEDLNKIDCCYPEP